MGRLVWCRGRGRHAQGDTTEREALASHETTLKHYNDPKSLRITPPPLQFVGDILCQSGKLPPTDRRAPAACGFVHVLAGPLETSVR